MKLIVCIDDEKGMLFNNRRQSRDRTLIDELVQSLNGAPLIISPYSEQLFQKHSGAYAVAENPLASAANDDHVFIENIDPVPYADKISAVIIYHWNRHYPSDMTFDLDMSPFHLAQTTEFVGYSHEKITKEVWVR